MIRHALPRAVAAMALFGLLAATAGPLSAQPAANPKKVLSFTDYDAWRSAGGMTLSRDGQYVAYVVGTDTDAEAVVRHVASGKEHRFPRGGASGFASSPKFAPDGKRAFLPLTPTRFELETAR